MKRYFSIDSISEEILEDEYWEGKFDCVFQLMATNSAETEEQACEMLNIDYQMFCKWKKQSDQEYNLQIVRKLRGNLFLITGLAFGFFVCFMIFAICIILTGTIL